MRFILFLFFIPLLSLNQNNYQKNKHVYISTKIINKNYFIHYKFKDHINQIHDVKFNFNKEETDVLISKMGIPYSMFDRFELTDDNIAKNHQILSDGLFKNVDNILELDYDAVVEFYRPSCKIIASKLINLLRSQNNDNVLNRIEILMKFIQDIPYGIPRKNKKKYKNGCLAPIEVLIEGFGDCDSKTLLFASILTHMIPSNDIIFIKGDNHVLTAVHYDEQKINKKNYFKYNSKKYYICETAGPGRRLFGEKSLKRSKYELFPLTIQ